MAQVKIDSCLKPVTTPERLYRIWSFFLAKVIAHADLPSSLETDGIEGNSPAGALGDRNSESSEALAQKFDSSLLSDIAPAFECIP
jgi:hypothetical protein